MPVIRSDTSILLARQMFGNPHEGLSHSAGQTHSIFLSSIFLSQDLSVENHPAFISINLPANHLARI
jgi:hypothetical protein